MKQLSIRHLGAEKHYVDDWAAYIEKKEMTEEEALEYLRDANSRTDRYAHIVDMDTFEARTADKRDDGEDTVDVYREFSLSDQRTRVQFIENMRRIFSGQSGVLGKYRIRETQTTVIGVGESVELKQADGTKKAYLLLRAIPVDSMKKRESKSETFSADPFEYEFLYAPMADDGVCEFVEPWFGFAVSQNSDDYEYALEFLRFLAQEDQLNTLASVKGVPSATKNSSDARYEGIQNAENVAARYINDGTILNHVKNYFKQTASGLGNGDYATTEDAARDYVQRCAEVAAQMAEDS